MTPAAIPGDETDWLAGLGAREPAAVQRLLDALRRGLGSALGRRADVGAADLDDFAQEAAMKVLAALDGFRGDSRLTTWAMAIAVRTALTALRRRSARSTAPLRDDVVEAPAGRTDDASLEQDELNECLRRAINRDLTDRQRSAILAFLGGAPQVVLAERLGVSGGAFHKMMHDARVRLRRSLEASGFDASTVMRLLET